MMFDDDKRTESFLTKTRKVIDNKTYYILSESVEQSFWSKKWIELFQTLDSGNRISQGKYFAKMGQVVYLKIQKGFAIAKVQDNKPLPYRVRIELEKIPEDIWTKILNDIANDTSSCAKLLARQLPHKITDYFEKYGYSFLPVIDNDLKAGCTCPDWANPCKHTSAAFYIFAQLISENPFILFKIRGKTESEIFTILREIRLTISNDKSNLGKESSIEEFPFHNLAEDYSTENEFNFLENLEESPIILNGQTLNTLFKNGYSAIKKIADRKLGLLKEKIKEKE